MTTVPLLLDARSRYLGQAGVASQLLIPTPAATLLSELAAAVAVVSEHPPIVLPAFVPDPPYVAAVRRHCPAVESVLEACDFGELLGRLDPSDAVLFISAACVPADQLDLRSLVRARDQTMVVRHLIAFEATTVGTKEFVQTGEGGRVRRIQRYFDPVTWPFPIGVIASLVPVACFQVTKSDIPLDSLASLRRALSDQGIPAQDVPYRGPCFHLGDERDALALSEARLRATPSEPSRGGEPSAARQRAVGTQVHESARLIGVVAVGAGVVIEAGALVIGPTLIGEGARIGCGAVVAQCLVLPGAVIEQNAMLRHRVVAMDSEHNAAEPRAGQRRHSATGGQQSPVASGTSPWRLTYPQLKTVAEPLLALLAIIAMAPMLACIALLVWLTSEGPILYGDPREGRAGRPFKCWKFRTMLVNADALQRALRAEQAMDGPQFKMDHDPRVTRAGRLLRRLNLDELPQLWNVMRGEMSFVGPRPSPFRENQICVAWRHGRLSVPPGITGLWQVCRHDRALGDFHQWIQYDLLYVRNVSFRVDVRILVSTFLTLGGRWPVPLVRILGPQHGVSSNPTVARRLTVVPSTVVLPAPRGRPTVPARYPSPEATCLDAVGS